MAVTLIQNPPFVLNLQEYAPPLSPLRSHVQKVQDVALKALAIIKALGVSAYQAVATNVGSIWSSFQVIVLGMSGNRFNPPTNAYVLGFRAALWAGAITIGFIYYTIVITRQNLLSIPGQLANFIHRQLDAHHLVSKNTSIDVSHVPHDIQVGTLISLYDEINFTNPDAPGYMPPSTRRESYGQNVVEFSVDSLRNHLGTFIQHVENREAFLGTPPELLVGQLMKFYQKIEDAVRFSLHKVTKDYDDFILQHQGVQITKEHPDYQRYNELLQAKARVAIDMAIAGAHCGARYMGDSIDTYLALRGEVGDNIQGLQGNLYYLLGKVRERIAREQIYQNLGGDTHHFARYMANLGTLLGLPGTEDVIEYLTGGRFDRDRHLRNFFEVYTPTRIREEVQNEIKTSQAFRETVYDWLKDHSKEWNKDVYTARQEAIISAIKPIEQSSTFVRIEKFVDFVKTIPEELKTLPDMDEDWNLFIDDLLVLDKAKAQYNPIDRNQLKTLLVKDQFKDELKAIIKEGKDLSAIKEICLAYDNAAQINRVITANDTSPIDIEVLYRAVTNKQDITPIIKDHLDRARGIEFLEAITRSETDEDEEPGETVIKQGLKPGVLDWILFESKILRP